jgi:hypothetical protein
MIVNLLPFILCLSLFAQPQGASRLERDIVPEEFIKARPVKPSTARRERVRYRRVSVGSAGMDSGARGSRQTIAHRRKNQDQL